MEQCPFWQSSYSQEILRTSGTPRFIAVFTTSCHLSEESGPLPSCFFLRSILVLCSHVCLARPSSLWPARFLVEALYAFICHPLVHFGHMNNIWWGVQIMQLLIMQSYSILTHYSQHIPTWRRCETLSLLCHLTYAECVLKYDVPY
jgi:hypothetical protein